MTTIERIDTILPIWSDWHSGSPTALFPLKQMELYNGNIGPTATQRLIHGQFDEMIDKIVRYRSEKWNIRIVNMFNGDAVEGIHHSNKQVSSILLNDHKNIHLELMNYAMKRIGMNEKDMTFYTSGTESHAGESEEDIAKDLGAIPYNERRFCHPVLKLNINGKWLWFAHQGANPGKDGTGTKGNVLRNKLKQIYFDCLERGKDIPQYVFFSHFHHKWHEQIDTQKGTIDGFVLPSFQAKTQFSERYFPFEFENIGGLIMRVSAEGIVNWEWSCMEFESTKGIMI